MNTLVLGGDKRFVYTARKLGKKYSVATHINHNSDRFDCMVLGLPGSRDGVHINAPMLSEKITLESAVENVRDGGIVFCGMPSEKLFTLCSERGISLRDYYKEEELIIKNALLTAEGAVAVAIDSTPFSLWDCPVLITGYGRIAFILARYLKSLGAIVTITARKSTDRIKAECMGYKSVSTNELDRVCKEMRIIFNTVPAPLFSLQHIMEIREDCVYIELASLYGIPEELLSRCTFRVINAQGLPAKSSAEAAGCIIADTIDKMLTPII